MRFRKLAVALVACMALTAVAATAAQAAVHWTVNGATLTEPKAVTVSGGPWTLESTLLGSPITLTAESVECASAVTPCTIEGAGESMGALKYTGVKVTNPSTCSVPGNAITTEKLKDQIIMDPSGGSVVFDKFTPAGEGTTFAVIKLEGATCPLAGAEAPVKGTATGQSPNATGVEKEVQSLSFGSSQQATGGGSLTLGKAPATLTGTANNFIGSGTTFGATE